MLSALYALHIHLYFCPTLCIYLCIPETWIYPPITMSYHARACPALTEKMSLATATNSIPDNPVQSSIPELTSMTYTP